MSRFHSKGSDCQWACIAAHWWHVHPLDDYVMAYARSAARRFQGLAACNFLGMKLSDVESPFQPTKTTELNLTSCIYYQAHD
jgi:hypothetical protein